MARNKAPIPYVAVLDGDRAAAREVRDELRNSLPGATVQSFSKDSEAWKKMAGNPRHDPYLVVTDWIGTFPRATSFVAKVRRGYPKACILLYSRRATPEQVLRLQNDEKLIDIYVHKNSGLKRLAKEAERCFRRHETHPVLNSVRQFLAECGNPDAPFTVIGNKHYSLLDLYWEMVWGTKIGAVAEEGWRSLTVRVMMAKTALRARQ